MIPLRHTMSNGATIGDWLGTAATNARVAATRIDKIRTGHEGADERVLDKAIRDLEDALHECRVVRSAVRSAELQS